MNIILIIFEGIIGVLLIGAIILQNQGGGISTTFGGAGEFYRSKRSVEKLLLWATGVLAFLFAAIALILLLHR